MSNVHCIFCKQDRDKAKEHIWPKWLQEKMIGTTNWSYSGTHDSISFPISFRKHTGENLVLGDVCKMCNNGWMSNLENNFRPIIEKIQMNTNGLKLLSKYERNIFSVWAFKTSIVINAGTNYRKVVPLKHFHHLYENKSVAKDIKIDTCYIKEHKKLEWIQTQLNYAVGPIKKMERSPVLLTDNNYNITMQIGNLGIRVSWYKKCKANGFILSNSENQKTLQIWPYKKNNQLSEKQPFDDIGSFQSSLFLKSI